MPRVTIPQIEPTPNTVLPCVPYVEDFMCRDLCVVTPDALLGDVVRCMIEAHAAMVPVVETRDDGLHLLGVVSDRDCLMQLSNEAFFGNPYRPKKARTVMRTPPAVVSPKADVFTLISLLNEHGCEALPVVDG
ncbi:MAG TPA: CBS domain-containing protein, partial [Planctomycetaceae bacterium]|nr:CBS domain-containing protein [Planctomycetaceae bacterium]